MIHEFRDNDMAKKMKRNENQWVDDLEMVNFPWLETEGKSWFSTYH